VESFGRATAVARKKDKNFRIRRRIESAVVIFVVYPDYVV
jgi:hypothetical protein